MVFYLFNFSIILINYICSTGASPSTGTGRFIKLDLKCLLAGANRESSRLGGTEAEITPKDQTTSDDVNQGYTQYKLMPHGGIKKYFFSPKDCSN